METMTEYVEIVKTVGVPVALVVYFLFKDWRFTARLEQLFGRIEETLERVRS